MRLEKESKDLRICALKLSKACKDGNLQSVFSCLDIMWVLYDKIMNWSVKNMNDDNRDYFVISKGQATLALYPILIKKGLFEFEEIYSEIGDFKSRYCIQTDLTKFSGGIENNAGSLGHGLPYAVGLAYAGKIKKTYSKVFVLCGDGEFCEGTMWESCIFAGAKKLDNLNVIIDDNDSVGAMVDMSSMRDKLMAFGFDVYELDGHNTREILLSFDEGKDICNGRPKAYICHTVRGYGSNTMMEHDIWFHKAPNDEELDLLIKEVEEF